MVRYNPRKIEEKWQKKWLRGKIYEPDFKKAKRPFYNLMMFPYPSGEGLHVGHAYTFSGADIFGRLKRMRGNNVFQPIGYDSFGIHSENYALKIGQHPKDLIGKTTKRYEGQLKSLGIGYAWREELKTSDPEYYRWTQWIFLQLFKKGLAYRKKSPVNWCSGCQTVLADEQVVGGECERCGTQAIKKELEQWFFKITDYADRLLENLEHIDWSEKIKIAQKNWIGKSEGAIIEFSLAARNNYILLHGFKGTSEGVFFPWLKNELKKRNLSFFAPQLPNASRPKEKEQVVFVLKEAKFDEHTILFGHSLGAVVALKAAENLKKPIAGLVLAGGFLSRDFKDRPRPFQDTFSWKFDFEKIKKNVGFVTILSDPNDFAIPLEQGRILAEKLDGRLVESLANKPHFTSSEEPLILENLVSSFKVFTTRPDTLLGATYMVVAPEHALIKNLKFKIQNWPEVEEYINKTKLKSEEERIAEGKEKTGVELKGLKAVNPANSEEIPVWVADYVLGQVGTGAIMAVPAHDQRDFAFAKKYNLPVKMVVCPHYPEKTCPVLDKAYEGEGHLVGSGKFDGMTSQEARWKITEFVGGVKKTQYRLRDWLISRQRYWGPPIPMVYCNKCGWRPVPEKDLPVKLPYIKNFRPTGTEKSPLALVEKFYKVRCPKCKSWARRETDVSDTFLDSAWYYVGYLMKFENWKLKIENSAFSRLARRWLPVDMYIGGAEHAVLHLLYVRFITMALYDLKMLHFEEPFKKFRAHGLLIKDGAKMSKSRGNVVNPDEYIRAYGADALRMYLMFLGPFEQGGDFGDTGIKGITRFLERVWKLIFNFSAKGGSASGGQFSISKKVPDSKSQIQKTLHQTIKKVTEDIENLQYNTAISALMVLLNNFEENKDEVGKEDFKIFLKLLAPFAPHICEELYQSFGGLKKVKSIHLEKWPVYDPQLIKEDTFELVIQVNGRVRGLAKLPVGASENEAKKAALALDNIKQYVKTEPQKVIFVPDRLINFVV